MLVRQTERIHLEERESKKEKEEKDLVGEKRVKIKDKNSEKRDN